MKYLEALKSRDLSIENLPKVLQKKIQELEYQFEALKQLEENPNEELSESQLSDIEIVKTSVKELDSHIEHKVKIFDPSKYKEKLEKISLMTKAKEEIKKGGEVEHQEIEVKEPAVEVVKQERAPQQEPAPKAAPIVENIHVAPPPPPPAHQPVYQEQEADEFDKEKEVKPKKMTTGVILMGVGAFFLTWGAVNFFRSRR